MRNYFLLFFVLTFSTAFGQDGKIMAAKIDSRSILADQFLGYDQFGFHYLIKNNVFYKINERETLEYKNLSLGDITKVDLQNPLKIVLFYEVFNTAVLLDNQLNETKKINFSENPIPILVTAIGIASQNRLWIYNSLSQQIGFFDYLKNDYKPLSIPFSDNFKSYQSSYNFFDWIDKKNNLYSCDAFGKITPMGKIPDFESILIIAVNKFIFSKGNVLYYVDIEKNKKYEIKILEKTFNKFTYKDQILSIFTAEAIINYKITLP